MNQRDFASDNQVDSMATAASKIVIENQRQVSSVEIPRPTKLKVQSDTLSDDSDEDIDDDFEDLP